MRTNYHTHTQRCRHAQGSEEDYIRQALDANVSVLGFADHAPFPDKDYGYRMPYEELEEYFFTVDRMAEEYACDIIIKKGLEIEYMPQYQAFYERLYEKYSVDYLLLGEHFFFDEHGNFVNIALSESTENYVSYAKAVRDAMRTGYFQMVAHPDIFAMNRFAWDRNCDLATDLILDAAAETGTILEYNANGFRRGIQDYPDGRRYMYPHKLFWRRAAAAGLRVIVGSDCHEPKQVWDACMLRSLSDLAELGITPLETLD